MAMDAKVACIGSRCFHMVGGLDKNMSGNLCFETEISIDGTLHHLKVTNLCEGVITGFTLDDRPFTNGIQTQKLLEPKTEIAETVDESIPVIVDKKESEIDKKICSSCNIKKPVSDFYKNQYYCKACIKKYRQAKRKNKNKQKTPEKKEIPSPGMTPCVQNKDLVIPDSNDVFIDWVCKPGSCWLSKRHYHFDIKTCKRETGLTDEQLQSVLCYQLKMDHIMQMGPHVFKVTKSLSNLSKTLEGK